jgi:hypothetical protein
MAKNPRSALLLSPPAITVHDNGNMLWQIAQVNEFFHFAGMILTFFNNKNRRSEGF